MSSILRRDFLRRGVSATAALALPSTFFIGKSYSASDEIGLGIIGVGGRGNGLKKTFMGIKGVRIVAMADPDKSRVEKAAEPLNAKTYTDLRKLLENPDVDAVVVSTCNHWHCLASIMAMQAGKDVYVEKPLSHTQWEGRQVVNAARKYNRIVQLGTQQRSDPLQEAAKNFLHKEKALGAIRYVQANRLGVRGTIGKRESALPIPPDVNYNLWLGPAQDQKLYRNELHYDWHWDFNTGNGEMGNWGVHVLDDVRNVAYQDSVTTPKRVFTVGGRVAWNDAGNTPNVQFVCFDTGTFPTMIALSNLNVSPTQKGSWKIPANRPVAGPGSGYVVACEGGYYLGHRGGGEAVDLDGKVIKKFKGSDMMKLHTQNFIDAVRSRKKSSLNAEIEVGHDSTGWCNLANVAFQTGQAYSREQAESIMPNLDAWGEILNNMESRLGNFDITPDNAALKMSPILTHDPKTERFVGDHAEVANRFLKRKYRYPFVVPEISS